MVVARDGFSCFDMPPTFRHHEIRMMTTDTADCELCVAHDVVAENSLAYVRYDNTSLSRGHVLVIPRRHVANFFDMTTDEQSAVLSLLNHAQRLFRKQHAPDGYNIGVNIGKAEGQSRMHVHVHLIPRYTGDVPNPQGQIRRVLAEKALGAVSPRYKHDCN
jgi:diadenosine tetraphosphate (Ap4A) HIT family hydrolase